jgi:hypothetical protein
MTASGVDRPTRPGLSTGRRVITLLEKSVLGFIAGVAAAIGLLDAGFLVGRIVGLSTPGPHTLESVPLADPVAADAIASSSIVSADYRTVTLVVTELPDAAIAALIAAAVLSSLLTIGTCVAVAWLCVRVLIGRPFVRSATLGISVVAILVLLAGFGAPMLRGIANTEAVEFLGYDHLALLLFEVDFAPLGAAFALIVVAAAFEIGQRLQHETQGLV